MIAKYYKAPSILVLVIISFVANQVLALKIKVFSLPEQVEQAELIAIGTISQQSGNFKFAVREVLKGDRSIQTFNVGVDWRRPEDKKLPLSQSCLVCVGPEVNGIRNLIGFGNQAVWPKTENKWPFTPSHVSSLETVREVVRSLLVAESSNSMFARQQNVAKLIQSNEPLAQMAALELVELKRSSELLDVFSKSRDQLTNSTNQDVSKKAVHIKEENKPPNTVPPS